MRRSLHYRVADMVNTICVYRNFMLHWMACYVTILITNQQHILQIAPPTNTTAGQGLKLQNHKVETFAIGCVTGMNGSTA